VKRCALLLLAACGPKEPVVPGDGLRVVAAHETLASMTAPDLGVSVVDASTQEAVGDHPPPGKHLLTVTFTVTEQCGLGDDVRRFEVSDRQPLVLGHAGAVARVLVRAVIDPATDEPTFVIDYVLRGHVAFARDGTQELSARPAILTHGSCGGPALTPAEVQCRRPRLDRNPARGDGTIGSPFKGGIAGPCR
jgi:hypothetical protein